MATRRLKLKAMDAALTAGVKIDNVEQFCREHDVSPRTFYRHRARIAAEGGWHDKPRRPHRSPGASSPELEAWICKLRADLGVDNGADYIRDELTNIAATTNPTWRVPARSTINRVLARHDLLERNPAKRPRSSWRRFAYAQPRDCYQIDATELKLATGQAVVVFDVLDDCTRLLVACRAAPAETTNAAITAITTAFDAHGTPAIVLADNGPAFTNRWLNPNAGPSRFTTTVTTTGARLIHSSPYHPQTCGKVERHHQTLKKWLAEQPSPNNLADLQRQLDTYQHHYNSRRTHSALARKTPQHAWDTAPHHGGPTALPIQTDATVHRSTVSATGVINVGRHRIGIGCAYTATTLTAIRDRDHVTVYNPDGTPLGHATITATKNYTPLTHLTP
jgi:putative transposase